MAFRNAVPFLDGIGSGAYNGAPILEFAQDRRKMGMAFNAPPTGAPNPPAIARYSPYDNGVNAYNENPSLANGLGSMSAAYSMNHAPEQSITPPVPPTPPYEMGFTHQAILAPPTGAYPHAEPCYPYQDIAPPLDFAQDERQSVPRPPAVAYPNNNGANMYRGYQQQPDHFGSITPAYSQNIYHRSTELHRTGHQCVLKFLYHI
ncbi:hypothetical protein BJ912DRAFT_1144267 [Pholiota molesta]|nr:hypothetical protein BJ912DRAFT_1144267 [Pholiota molesta]